MEATAADAAIPAVMADAMAETMADAHPSAGTITDVETITLAADADAMTDRNTRHSCRVLI